VEGHFRVGPWLVQPSLNAISRGGMSSHLTPKAMEVLVCLAEHAGEPISKEKLLQAIWPDTFVSEDVLKGAISELRRVFEDDAKEPHIIQTIAKRGYRLIAPIEPLHETARESLNLPNPAALPHSKERTSADKWWTPSLVLGAVALVIVLLGAFNVQGLRQRLIGQGRATRIRSLAVLPLQNLSADPDQEYFSDGMTDALITDLAQIGSLEVISRTSSARYKQTKKSLPEIARELNVDGIVTGTVQRSGDRVRITAQLIQGPEDRHLWASSYQGEMRDVFALERDVTEEIARQVRVRLRMPNDAPLTQPLQVNPKALDAYLQGNYYLTRGERSFNDEEKRKAAEYFQEAIDVEPNFTPAYIGLANAHDNRRLGSSEDKAIMTRAAEKALVLDPKSSEAMAILASVTWANFEWSMAETEYREAVELNPNSASAHDGLGDVLAATGRLDEALRESQIAQALDPNIDHLSTVLEIRGEYDRASDFLLGMAKGSPEDGIIHYELFRIYAASGKQKEAVDEMEKALMLFGMSDGAANMRRGFSLSGYLGAIRELARDTERLQANNAAFLPENLAAAYTALGEKDRAFYWLEQAYEHHDEVSHDWGLMIVKVDPLLAPLRSDPRFKDLLRRVGLPP